MKKLLILLLLISFNVLCAEAKPTEKQVRAFFYSYVTAVNAYSPDIFSKYYLPNATIYRVVQKKDGTTQQVTVPMSIYKDESRKGEKLAKFVKYTNDYTNIRITPQNNDFRIDAVRKPSMGGSFPAYFVIGEDNSGNLKIKVESMNTPRQEFLQKQ